MVNFKEFINDAKKCIINIVKNIWQCGRKAIKNAKAAVFSLFEKTVHSAVGVFTKNITCKKTVADLLVLAFYTSIALIVVPAIAANSSAVFIMAACSFVFVIIKA